MLFLLIHTLTLCPSLAPVPSDMQQLNFCLVPWQLQQGQLNKTLAVHYLYSRSLFLD